MTREITADVRYCECDPMGIVNNSVYAVWCEAARLDYLEAIGVTFEALRGMQVAPAMVSQHIDYVHAVTYPNRVRIRTCISDFSPKKIELSYEISVGKQLSARCKTLLVWVCDGHSVDLSVLNRAIYSNIEKNCEAAV